jgi:2-oxo-4-hydroxy-4-carboxy-5-ureidoimidazoline decarboxylase
VTLDEINALDREAFTVRLGAIAEDSPWVAYGAYDYRPFADALELVAAFRGAVARADEERQVALIRAHPDLAGRAAIAGELTAHSRSEQATAGLDRLTAAEYARFTNANAAYRERFGFPFVICVRDGGTKETILAAYEQRLAHDPAVELAIALDEIVKIMRLRIADLLTA